MRRRQIPRVAVYHVVEDADDVLERPDGRTERVGIWEDREIRVVTEGESEPLIVVTVTDRTRGRRWR
jgi:hypothetical protein